MVLSEERKFKRCPACRVTKRRHEFPRNRSSKDGLAAYCKPCHNQKMKEIADRLYGGHANFLRMKRYGIDAESLKRMIEGEQGLCALCRERPARHVDHVHDTSMVRGVLCFSCNRGLGKFSDDPEIIRSAIAYLRRPA